MSETMIAALIGAGATLLVTLITYYMGDASRVMYEL